MQPDTPGMVIDGAFVPSTRRVGVPRQDSAAAATGGKGVRPEALREWLRTQDGGAYVKVATGALPTTRALRKRLQGAHAPGVLPNAGAALGVARAMHRPVRRKLRRLTKWLDDEWLKGRIVPETNKDRLVLPNGMVLHSSSAWHRRRPALVAAHPTHTGPAARARQHARPEPPPHAAAVSIAPGRDEAASLEAARARKGAEV